MRSQDPADVRTREFVGRLWPALKRELSLWARWVWPVTFLAFVFLRWVNEGPADRWLARALIAVPTGTWVAWNLAKGVRQ